MCGPFGGTEAAKISRNDPGEQGWTRGTSLRWRRVHGQASRTITAPWVGYGAPRLPSLMPGSVPPDTKDKWDRYL